MTREDDVIPISVRRASQLARSTHSHIGATTMVGIKMQSGPKTEMKTRVSCFSSL